MPRALCFAAGLLPILLFAGCASHYVVIDRAQADAAATPPPFLIGPSAVLLTNISGFRATVQMEKPGEMEAAHPVSGEFFGRDGRLLFAPRAPAGEKKMKGAGAAAMTLVWDTREASGFEVNDALQGYAPIRGGVAVTQVSDEPGPAISEEANGHPCRRTQVTVVARDGQTTQFIVWRAKDLNGFPVRIKSGNGGVPFTLNFIKVQLEAPERELFQLPRDFTAYASADVMLTELQSRQNRQRSTDEDEPTEGVPRSDSQWRNGTSRY